jgi:hypothetical protein
MLLLISGNSMHSCFCLEHTELLCSVDTPVSGIQSDVLLLQLKFVLLILHTHTHTK